MSKDKAQKGRVSEKASVTGYAGNEAEKGRYAESKNNVLRGT